MRFYEIAMGQPRPAGKMVKAILVGEKRSPRNGEWFISGAIPEAYRAHSDMMTPYHIARLVKVKEITEYEIEEYL